MHTKESLIEQLKSFLPADATVLMHSSCKSLGEMENGADTLLDALMEYFGKEGLICLPTHSWALVGKKQPVYDVLETPSNVGILPELFRKRESVYRSWHPTHSIAAYGKDAWEFLKGDENCLTPCGRNSAWGRLYDRDAYVMLVGVELNRMTFFHGVEEWADIPERVDMDPAHANRYVVITPEGKRLPNYYQPHVNDPSSLFPKVEKQMLDSGAMKLVKLGDATVRLLSARKSADVLLEILKEDPWIFGMKRGS